MGRPPKLTPHQQQEALRRREAGENLSDTARTYGVAHTTIGYTPAAQLDDDRLWYLERTMSEREAHGLCDPYRSLRLGQDDHRPYDRL